MNFPAVLSLATLDPATGVAILGQAASDRLGFAVSSAGDVNGDGYLDLVVGAVDASPNGFRSGTAYVVFGTATGLPAGIDLAALDGTNGFRIHGPNAYANAGIGVASAGDFNGDGFGDLIVGVPGDANLVGGAYVVFGKASGFPADLQAADFDGTNGFRFSPGGADLTGLSVGAGDFNGDGLTDLVIGAPFNDTLAHDAGAFYVIFGTTDPMAATLAPGDLDGANGFRIVGRFSPYHLGASVAMADVNGDGFDDVLASSPEAIVGRGVTFILHGTADVFPASRQIVNSTEGSLSAQQRDYSGRSVASAGDVNGDGIEDLIIGAPGRPYGAAVGGAFVVFGQEQRFNGYYMNNLNGSNGFVVTGTGALSDAGVSVASAGDIDADGYDDLIIGAPAGAAGGPGEAYILYGKASFASGAIDANTLDGYNGFRIQGADDLDRLGISVSGAGDLNGDGFDDLIVGADNVEGAAGRAGAIYVIYGRARDRTEVGATGDDTLTGHLGDDQLNGLEGKDRLDGAAGDDSLDGGDGNDLLYGGDGADDLVGGLGGDSLFGDAGADALSGGDGGDKLYGGSGADLLTGDSGNDRMAGEDGVDTLEGGDGNDLLDGGPGADSLTGGTGNDVFVVDDLGDQTIELPGGGYDIVRASLGWTLADNIEALELQGTGDIDGTGNGLANNLQGNAGNNTLSGLAGVDTINGNDGDDIIFGGEGNDLLRGGLGADTFVVAHAFGTTLETDQVYDFSAAEGDILDLMDAYAGTLALVSSFTRQAGQMTLTFAGGVTILKLDITGDGRVDYQMKINGDVTGESGSWIL